MSLRIFTCSHVRPVVYLHEEDGWFHIGPNGNPAGACVAGIYRDEFELPDDFHHLGNLLARSGGEQGDNHDEP